MRLSPRGNIGAGGRLGRSVWNKNQFLAHKLLDAKNRELFSISRALYSATRQIRSTHIRIVDEDHAGLHATVPVVFATNSWPPVNVNANAHIKFFGLNRDVFHLLRI